MFIWWHLFLIIPITILFLAIGVICGYHRYFTHSSFKTDTSRKIIMLFFGTLASVGAVVGWVSVHRKHHRYSDTPNDPHSPYYKSWYRVWFGYFFNIYQVEGKYGAKLLKDKHILFFQKYYYPIILISVLPILFLGLPIFIAAYSIPQLLTLNATSAINVINHTKGIVKDNIILSVLIFGEGWHAKHHAQPLSSRLHKYDVSGIIIEKFLENKNEH
jgi:fatty-acid desaturase